MDMNINRYEKLMQVPPWGAERASSDVVTSEEYRPVDQRRSMMTVAEVCTTFVDKSELTLSQGSAVVAEEAGTDGTTNVRDRSIDRNTMETTNMQMPMDFLEIPKPTLPRGFLELAEEARNVKIESGQFRYTEEVQSQGTGLTRPVGSGTGITDRSEKSIPRPDKPHRSEISDRCPTYLISCYFCTSNA